jgi:hypothetical protein
LLLFFAMTPTSIRSEEMTENGGHENERQTLNNVWKLTDMENDRQSVDA